MITPPQPARPRSPHVPAPGSGASKYGATGQPQTAHDQAVLVAQQSVFNSQLEERAELQREFNELRALQMEQLKHDDEIVKKWIALI